MYNIVNNTQPPPLTFVLLGRLSKILLKQKANLFLLFLHILDDPEIYRGAPISLQLVGRRYEDEKVVEALEYITEKIKLPFTQIG